MRRAVVLAVALPLGLAIALVALGENTERFANRISGPPLPEVSANAARVHRSSFVVDLHADSLLWGRDLSRRSTVGHVDLPRLREGGIGLQIFTIVTRFPAGASIELTRAGGLDLITLLALTNGWPRRTVGSLTDRALYQAQRLADVAKRDPYLRIVRTRGDLDRLLAARVNDPRWVGGILGIEGAHALDRPGALDEVFESGVRLIGLAHFFDNDYAGSAHGVAKGGLTERGRELVGEMERRGIIVDLTHSSAATIRDVLAIVQKPALISHTGVKGTCDKPRNLSDDQLRSVARAGGVIGIGDWPTAVCGDTPAAVRRVLGENALGILRELLPPEAPGAR
jgi:microsomal dipeptidase-like Zn-dependent dipeptidase